MLSQYSKLFLYDIISGECIYQQQVSQTKMLISSYNKENKNIYILDYKGQLFSFSIDKNNIIKYISQNIKNVDLGVKIASRYNVSESDDTFHKMFRLAVHNKNYKKAAKIAVEAPDEILRNNETIRILKNMTTIQDHSYPDLVYFQLLLDRGILNHEETVNLCKRVISINSEKGLKYIQKYLKEDKFTCSEILGDLLINYNIKMACSIYLKAKIHQKTILCFLRMKNWNNAIDFVKKNDLQVQWPVLLRKMHNSKRKDSLSLSLILTKEGFINPNECIKIFLDPDRKDIQNCISYLSEFLKSRGDREEDSILQTKLLELSITETSPITGEIVKFDNFTKYDKIYIARISEKAGLYQKALEHYKDINDVRRLISIAVDSDKISHKFLITFFGMLTSKNGLSCLDDLLKLKQSEKTLQLIVQISKIHSDLLGPHKIVQLFEKYNSYSGMYLYLESLIDNTEDSQLVFKYIQSSIEVNQIQKVEHLCKNNNIYDPLQVKKFLLEKNMINDPRPLIYVCDRHGFISELTIYLYNNQLYKFIEVYIQRMNPSSTPEVIGSLLDLNIPEDQIRELVNSVRPPQCPIKELVESFESRNR
jgi:clathrin heavy chain